MLPVRMVDVAGADGADNDTEEGVEDEEDETIDEAFVD